MPIEKNTVRHILLELGVPDFNATMAIPYMLIAPRALDPSMVQMIPVIKKLQEQLASMGAPGITQSGVLDEPTAAAIKVIAGTEWLAMPFYETIRATNKAEADGYTFAAPQPASSGSPEPVSGVLDVIPDTLGLPSVPGGIVTYGVGLYFLYKALKGKR